MSLGLVGCSTVETAGPGLASGAAPQRVQLKVRTGDSELDALVFDEAFMAFSPVMPLREDGPYTGALEITFASAGQHGMGVGSVSTAHARSGSWYSGPRSRGGLAGSGMFNWQDSTMEAVLRGADDERLWAADYDYHGGWEFSGFVVNTPAQAAHLIAKRLAVRYAQDSRRMPTSACPASLR